MWMTIGNKTKVRPVPGGRSVEQHCQECGQVRTFKECDVADKVSLFFVPVMDMKSRRLVCTECGEDCELPAEAAAPAVPRSAPPRASGADLDRMLADLKKKMGK